MTKKYDVALVGVGVGANYGSALTYYAIAEAIKDAGKSVVLVNKVVQNKNDIEITDRNPSYVFAKKHNELSESYTQEEVDNLNDLADTFVMGTDQVWNDSIATFAGEVFYLGFAHDDKRKISIAGSFGHFDDFSSLDKIERREELFKKFNKISTREFEGVKILRDKYHVDAKQIIEPVFYVDNEKWFKLADGSTMDTSEPYLLTYVLDNNPQKQQVIDTLSKKMGLPIKTLPDGFENVIRGGANSYKFTPEDVLKLLRDATYVITDSFHGTSFSLKFNKNFVTLVNPKRGISRFNTLIEIVGDDSRIIKDYAKIIDDPDRFLEDPDFSGINTGISLAVESAKNWIQEALDCDINVKVPTVEVDDTSFTEEITSKTYSFGRTDLNITYSDNWSFDPSGVISGYKNNNEYYWKVFGDTVYIYNQQKKFTSAFKQSSDVIGLLVGKGRDNIDSFFLRDNAVKIDKGNTATNKNTNAIKKYLTKHTFVWYRKSQKPMPLSKNVQLLEDGSIYGMPADASSKFWILSENGSQLDFVTFSGKVNVSMILDFDKDGLLKTKNGFWNRNGEEHILEDVSRFYDGSLIPIDNIEKPQFILTSNNWNQIENDHYYTVIRNAPGKLGDQAIIQLNQKLVANVNYSIKLKWSVKTQSPYVILHLRNSKSGKIQRAYFFKERCGDLSPIGLVPSLGTFVPDADGYDQVLFSSLQFIGNDAQLSISNLEIYIDSNELAFDEGEMEFDFLTDVVHRDYERFEKYHAHWHIPQNKENVRRNIMFFAHAVEKGLSHSNFRPKFGIGALTSLSKNLDLWYDFNKFDDVFFNIGLATIKQYFVKHESLDIEFEDRRSLFTPRVLKLIDSSTGDLGGVDVIDSRELNEVLQSKSLLDVMKRRRSLREWADSNVDLEKIKSAIEIALTTPSVCNRQNTNVYVVTEPDKIDRALKAQGGMVGFKNPPVLILVTNDTKGATFFTERNQSFIDGGLFTMSLLLGLEYERLAAVCLHTMVGTREDFQIREVLDVPESESLITFIAVGNRKEHMLTPHSQRITVDDVMNLR